MSMFDRVVHRVVNPTGLSDDSALRKAVTGNGHSLAISRLDIHRLSYSRGARRLGGSRS
jgi:hypothetical protein